MICTNADAPCIPRRKNVVWVLHVTNYIFLKKGEKGSHGDKGSQGQDGPQGQKGKQGPRGMPGTCDAKVFASRYLGFFLTKGEKGSSGDNGIIASKDYKIYTLYYLLQ